METNKIFENGDPIIIFEDMMNKSLHFLQSGKTIQNKFGVFDHNTIIGKTSGERVYNHKKTHFVIILKPTPSLVTETLAHKTQILYDMDISTIIMKLNIIPGSIVVESGTGSCSLSYSISHAVQDSGHLFTFEFNSDRVLNAQKLFENLKIKNVTVTHRDVCNKGFLPLENETPYALSKCDAVFLDLPKPWESIGFAAQVLLDGGRICCFSPCIEQVQKTHEELRKKGFVDVEMLESLSRTLERKERQKEVETGYKRKHKELEEEEKSKKQIFYSLGCTTIKGHTGFLTFATFKQK